LKYGTIALNLVSVLVDLLGSLFKLFLAILFCLFFGKSFLCFIRVFVAVPWVVGGLIPIVLITRGDLPLRELFRSGRRSFSSVWICGHLI